MLTSMETMEAHFFLTGIKFKSEIFTSTTKDFNPAAKAFSLTHRFSVCENKLKTYEFNLIPVGKRAPPWLPYTTLLQYVSGAYHIKLVLNSQEFKSEKFSKILCDYFSYMLILGLREYFAQVYKTKLLLGQSKFIKVHQFLVDVSQS